MLPSVTESNELINNFMEKIKKMQKAKRDKKDEFYTLYTDIENEINTYLEHDSNIFKNKTVLLPCDDPSMSNFTKYFFDNFAKLGLKKLISTCYAPPAPKSNSRVSIKDIIENNYPRGKIFEMTNSTTKEISWKYLEGNGDFRSKEITDLRDEADFIITNPPFSLFREFILWVNIGNKQFSVLGNLNAITYKNVFLLIFKKQLWLGASVRSGDLKFRVSDYYPINTKCFSIDKNNIKFINVTGIRWFTNIKNISKKPFLQLMTMKENLECNSRMKDVGYRKYNNYDAIDVPHVSAIPSDYDGIMGVPITFLDKYNSDQFEILGLTIRGCHDAVPNTKKYNDYWEIRQNGEKTGDSGSKMNDNPAIKMNNGKNNYYINSNGNVVQSCYHRVFIQHKRK